MVPKAEESDGRATSGEGFLAVSLYDHRPRECERSPGVTIRTSVNEGRVLLT